MGDLACVRRPEPLKFRVFNIVMGSAEVEKHTPSSGDGLNGVDRHRSKDKDHHSHKHKHKDFLRERCASVVQRRNRRRSGRWSSLRDYRQKNRGTVLSVESVFEGTIGLRVSNFLRTDADVISGRSIVDGALRLVLLLLRLVPLLFLFLAVALLLLLVCVIILLLVLLRVLIWLLVLRILVLVLVLLRVLIGILVLRVLIAVLVLFRVLVLVLIGVLVLVLIRVLVLVLVLVIVGVVSTIIAGSILTLIIGSVLTRIIGSVLTVITGPILTVIAIIVTIIARELSSNGHNQQRQTNYHFHPGRCFS